MQKSNQSQTQPSVELLLLQAIQLIQAQQQAAAKVEQQPLKEGQGSETMDVKEAAEYLKVSQWTVRDMVRTKSIPHFRVRSRIFFRRRELDQWVNSQLEGGNVMKCDKCNGQNDCIKMTVSGEELTLCVECREQFGKRISTKGWQSED